MVRRDDGGGWQWYPASVGADLKERPQGQPEDVIPKMQPALG